MADRQAMKCTRTLTASGLLLFLTFISFSRIRGQDLLPVFEVEPLYTGMTIEGDCFPVVYNGYLYSFSLEGERPLWRIFIGGDIVNPYAVEGRDLYFYDIYNRIYAIDIKDGNVRWVAPIEEEVKGRPVLYKEYLIIATLPGHIFVIDRSKGEVVLRMSAGGEINAGIQIYRDHLIVPLKNGRIFTYNVALQEEEWEFRTAGIISVIPLARNGKLFVGSWDSTLYSIDIETGKTDWARYVGSTVTREFIALEERIILFMAGGEAMSVRTTDGEIEWVRVFDGVEFNYNYFPGGTLLYVFVPDLIALDPSDGRTLFTYREHAYQLYKDMLFDNMVEGVKPIGEDERARLLRETYFSVQRYPYLPPGSIGDDVYFVTDDDFLYVYDVRDKFFRFKYRIE
jgi:outer membrane protein assembly factor BamB